MTDWIILRTSPRHTLTLAASLAEAGFVVWTPMEQRTKLTGKKREPVEQEMAILPEWVFARMSDLNDLLSLSHASGLPYRVWDSKLRRLVVRGHPKFWIFSVKPQSEQCLEPLRALEEALRKAAERRRDAAKCKGPIPKFKAGDMVRLDSGGFEGLFATVAEDNDGKLVKLNHPAWMWTVEISAWKLRDVQVINGSPEQGAALAA